ncbi:MAG: PAS domain S-box protein [Nitrospira sp.]|nr:PAS domain S-box protein [Nitrospira sp.]
MTAGLFLGLLLLVGLSLWFAIRQYQENDLKSRVIAATNCSVLVTDAALPHHPVIYANPAFRLLTGYAEHELLGQTTAILSGPATDRASIEKLALALQDGRACRVSLRHYRKNGTPFWNEVTLSPIEDRTGHVRSVIWVMRDVSRVLQAETGVQKVPSPTFLCDLASEGMLVTTESEVVYVNRTGLKILGAESAEQVIGSQYLDIVHGELQEAVRLWIVQTVGSSQSTRRLETQFLRRDGQGVVVELSVAPIMWDGKESVLIRFSDISCQRHTETQSFHAGHLLGKGQAIADSEHWGWANSNGAEIWSEEHYRVFGYEPGSVPATYETFKKALHPEDRDRVLTLVEDTFSSDRPYDIECRIIQPGGDVRFVRCRGVLIRGSSDQPIRMSGTIEDITDYRLLAAMADDRDLQFKTAMESVPNGMLMVRQDGTISLVNRNVERMFGYVREELLGRPIECLLTARDREQQREARAACLASIASSPTSISQELHGLRKDGSEFPVKICFHPVRLSKGRTILITMNDLTPREQAEPSLVDIEARFDLAVLAGRVGIFEYDHRTNTHLWSPILREIYGVSSEESASFERYLELVHPGDRERMHCSALRTPDPKREGLYTVEHRLIRPNGSIRHISLRTLTQCEGEGSMRRPMRTIGMVVDITDRVHSEMVVRVVKEMETMRTVTGGIAHELNNSLTAVLGFSELALALIPAETKAHRHLIQVITAGRKAREVAQRIRRAIDHASSYSIPRPVDQEPSTLPIEVSDAVGPRG